MARSTVLRCLSVAGSTAVAGVTYQHQAEHPGLVPSDERRRGTPLRRRLSLAGSPPSDSPSGSDSCGAVTLIRVLRAPPLHVAASGVSLTGTDEHDARIGPRRPISASPALAEGSDFRRGAIQTRAWLVYIGAGQFQFQQSGCA